MAYGPGIRRHGAANYFQVIDTANSGDTVRHDIAPNNGNPNSYSVLSVVKLLTSRTIMEY